MKRAALRICAIATAIGLTACGSHANPPAQLPQFAPHFERPMDTLGGPIGSRLNVLLGDAAPDLGGRRLEHLNLAIKEIDAVENGQATVLASYDRPRVVDVLAHQDDSGESVANTGVSRSEYQQLRLVVDLASSEAVFKGHKAQPVNFLVNVATSSTAGAGASTVTTADGPGAVDLVVTQPFSIPQGHNQTARVDFNAFESLTLDQFGDILTRATLFVAPVDEMGSATGTVTNDQGRGVANATVVAVASDGSIGNTGFTDDRGNFSIGTLRAGTYKLVVYNRYTTAAGRDSLASGQSTTAQTVSGPQITISGGTKTSAGTLAD